MPIIAANIPRVCINLLEFGHFFIIRKKSIFGHLEQSLEKASESGWEGLAPQELHRLREYVLLGAALGEIFCTLRGHAIAEVESAAFLNLSIFAPLFDDLFDHPDMPEERIWDLINNLSAFQPLNFGEKLLKNSLESIYKTIEDKSLFLERFNKVFHVQTRSKLQASREMDEESIREVTFGKGGNSALLYRTLLSHPVRPGEEEAFYQLGALIQWMDDIFDAHDDYGAGTRTLMTVATDVRKVKSAFEEEMWNAFYRFRGLDYREDNIKRFLFKLTLILSRGLVCLDQFQKLQSGNGGVFAVGKHTRKELLCDMETPANFLRSIRFCLSFQI